MALKIQYHNKLYFSDTISERELLKIRKQLSKKPLLSNVYLITPADNDNDLLQFFHSRQLAQFYYKNRPLHIIGITRTYQEAVLLLQKLVQECLDTRGDCSLREYLLC